MTEHKIRIGDFYMIYQYDYNVECAYIPIHMNSILNSNETNISKFRLNYINRTVIDSICSVIRKSDKKYFLLDFSKIKSAESAGTLTGLDSLFRQGKNLLLINLGELIYDQIINCDCCGSVVTVIDGVLTNKESKSFFFDTFINNTEINEDIRKFKRHKIADYLKMGLVEKEEYLNSSNIFANKYIDIKKTFLNHSYYSFIIYELCTLIDEKFRSSQLSNIEIDYLVCVSNNGVPIATILGQLLGLDVMYLMNLGPNLTVQDKNSINMIVKEKRYLLIFDFICLGAEYRITKSLLQFKDCIFLGGAGVALYTSPIRDENNSKLNDILLYLIDVSNSEYDFKYEVYPLSKKTKEVSKCH